MKKVSLIVLPVVAIYLLSAPLALSQGGNPPASTKESGATSGKGMTAIEQTGKGGGGTVEQEIRSLIDQTVEADLKADASFFEKHYAGDTTIIHGDGKMSTKAEEIEGFKSGAVRYESLDIREAKIRAYGNTAIVNLLTAVKANIHGKPVSSLVRDSRVWVKQDGIWKCVAFQATRVAPPSQ